MAKRTQSGRLAVISPINEAVGYVIRRIRNERGLTIEQLAWRAGVNRTHLNQCELGYYSISIIKLWAIAEALDVHPWIVLQEAGEHLDRQRSTSHRRSSLPTDK